MKTSTIFIIVLALGLLVAGCSKTTPVSTDNTGDSINTADINIETETENPDIGTLDDTAVSEELPQ